MFADCYVEGKQANVFTWEVMHTDAVAEDSCFAFELKAPLVPRFVPSVLLFVSSCVSAGGISVCVCACKWA